MEKVQNINLLSGFVNIAPSNSENHTPSCMVQNYSNTVFQRLLLSLQKQRN